MEGCLSYFLWPRIFRTTGANLPLRNAMLGERRETIMGAGDGPRSDADFQSRSSSLPGIARTDKATTEDAELIRRIRAGERELYYELVAPHERKIYIMAFSIVRNEAEAEDCVQHAVLNSPPHLHHISARHNLSNCCVQGWR